MNKRALLGLDVLVQLILVVFVLFSIYYAENKFLSKQNLEFAKESKRLSLITESLQLISEDVEITYKDINYTLSIGNSEISVRKDGSNLRNSFTKFDDQSSSCLIETVKVSDVDKNTYYDIPKLILVKKEGELSCRRG